LSIQQPRFSIHGRVVLSCSRGLLEASRTFLVTSSGSFRSFFKRKPAVSIIGGLNNRFP
jgi:hypothetical protein